jgi:O-antigen/teichoic acid export membrane protein
VRAFSRSLFVGRVQSTADVLYLDLWSGDAAAVGHYGIATLLLNGLALAPSAVAAAAFPYLAGRSENVRDVVALGWFILRRVLMLMVPLCVATFFVAPALVAWTFGPAYMEAVPLFRILIPAAVLGCGTLLAGSILFAIEQAGLALAVNAVTAITGLALNYVLIPRAGAAGSAWAMDLNRVVELAMYGVVLGWVYRQTYSKGRRTIMADLEPHQKRSQVDG